MGRSARSLIAVALCALSACGTAEAPHATGPTGGVTQGGAERLEKAIASNRGDPLVVNYWATWCDPCKKEMPRLTAAAKRYAGRVAFLGVNVEDDRAAAQDFARRYAIPFRSYALTRNDVQREQDILGLPVTQFYGPDGELAFVHQGEISKDDLEEKIEELLRLGGPAGRS